MQQQRFEILFEIGAYAILDGYYREAVSSFTSGIERFYEYALRVLLEGKSPQLFESCWKPVASQSERQLGAFIFSWAAQFGEAPQISAQGQVEVRNRVIHKGQIPTKIEAIKYGNAALDMIRPQLKKLEKQMPNEVLAVLRRHLQSAAAVYKPQNPVATMALSTLVNGQGGDPSKTSPTIEEYLNRLAEWSEILKSSMGPRMST